MKTIRRRRKEKKTDYGIRIKLLKSGSPRVIFRKTNRYIIAEYAESNEAKDRIILGVTSKLLLKYGWPEDMKGSLKSVPASYLTGFLFGKKITSKKMKNPILDVGMIRAVNKSKVFAFVKGLIDSGIKIECKEEMFPEKDRISGKNLRRDFSVFFGKIKSKIEEEKIK